MSQQLLGPFPMPAHLIGGSGKKWSEVTAPGYYWQKWTTWEVVEVYADQYSRELYVWQFREEARTPIGQLQGKFYGPLDPPA